MLINMLERGAKAIQFNFILSVHKVFTQRSDLQPPEPKANGGWEGRLVRLTLFSVSSL